MRLAAVMQQIADRLETIDGLRADGYPREDVNPPANGAAAIVGYPEGIEEESYDGGLFSTTVPVWVVVGKVSDRATRDRAAEYVDTTGPKSVKERLESSEYTAFDTISVSLTSFDAAEIAAVPYLAARFDCEITGSR